MPAVCQGKSLVYAWLGLALLVMLGACAAWNIGCPAKPPKSRST